GRLDQARAQAVHRIGGTLGGNEGIDRRQIGCRNGVRGFDVKSSSQRGDGKTVTGHGTCSPSGKPLQGLPLLAKLKRKRRARRVRGRAGHAYRIPRWRAGGSRRSATIST